MHLHGSGCPPSSRDSHGSGDAVTSRSFRERIYRMRPKRLSTSYNDASGRETRVLSTALREIQLQHIIGTGTFGTIYAGTMDGESVAV